MACIYTEDSTEPVVEIRVLGRVTQHDMDEILPKLESFIAKHGTIRLVEVLESFQAGPSAIHAVYSPGRHLPSKIRCFIDYFADAFQDCAVINGTS